MTRSKFLLTALPVPALLALVAVFAVRAAEKEDHPMLPVPTTAYAPDKATKCNCSICRRLGGLWAYYEFGTVRIEGHPENTAEYVWGDKTLRNVRCKTCGCATHWEPLAPEPGGKHGVNLNNFDPRLQEAVRVRRFDGADTWTFID